MRNIKDLDRLYRALHLQKGQVRLEGPSLRIGARVEDWRLSGADADKHGFVDGWREGVVVGIKKDRLRVMWEGDSFSRLHRPEAMRVLR